MAGKSITTETLRETLFETIEGVLDGSITTGQAGAVAKLSKEIISSAELEMDYARLLLDVDGSDTSVSPGRIFLGEKKSPTLPTSPRPRADEPASR